MIINGKEFNYNSMSVENLLSELNLNKERVVVEINRDIIKKEEFASRIINKEDIVEIISFVGGG